MSIQTFEQLGIDQDLINVLKDAGITEPSAVQREAIPVLLEGRDALAQSQTGTGKTLAYLLPILQRIQPDMKDTQALIIAPTQELAMQIVREAEQYGEAKGIRALGLIGGAAVSRQIEKLRQHPQVVAGTPGRIKELISMRKLKMHQVQTIVIDEADQVFQLGGASAVNDIIRASLKSRQLVFLSATLGKEIRELADKEMTNPVDIGIEPDQRTSRGLTHQYFVCEERDKLETLRRIVRHFKTPQAIVFVNDTESIAEVESKLNFLGLSAKAIYGDADKVTRSTVLNQFRSNKFKLLVASDVAARGLDIKDLELVIHLDPAIDSEHYVHRAGRTGRMGKTGLSISLVTPKEIFIMKKFARELSIRLEEGVLFEGKILSPEEAARKRAEHRSSSGRSRNKPTANTDTVRKSERARDRKNKGAPKWLKDKRTDS